MEFIESFLSIFDEVEDVRVDGMVIYPIDEILLLSLCGVLCGGDDWHDIAIFGELQLDFLRGYRPYSNGTPSEYTLSRLFRSIDSRRFEECFTTWLQTLYGSCPGVIAIDGKTIRGSRDGDKRPLHILSAFSHVRGVVIGQQAVSEKSNEIPAIPELLAQLTLEGNIVTCDAMGCQKEIASAIIDRKADYILALKGNQSELHMDITTFFEETRAPTLFYQHEDTDAGHGRIEVRKCIVTSDILWLKERHDWKNLQSIIRVESTRIQKRTNVETTETRYYISSLAPDPKKLLESIRAHWSIENTLHWSLDVTFREDYCRSRKDHAALNFAIIRKTVLNLLKQKKDKKLSIKSMRKKAGWNQEFLISLLETPISLII